MTLGFALNLWIAFNYIAIFTMLILLIHKYGKSFHLPVPSSISFSGVLYFWLYRSFTSLVKFIPSRRFFICLFSCFVFEAIAMGLFF
jgi:hypothetical protein